ncbi:MAG: hypothetical protein MK081_16105 [Flavobacteriales bacterium]|nr:hypothetical protein [Flavobacteriales bacterium]
MKFRASAIFYALTFVVISSLTIGALIMVYSGYGNLNDRLEQEQAMRSFHTQATNILLEGGFGDSYKDRIEFRGVEMEVEVLRESWGWIDLYHVKTQTNQDTILHTHLMSAEVEATDLRFSIADRGRAIRLSGNAQVIGSGNFPERGFERVSLGGTHFNGVIDVNTIADYGPNMNARLNLIERTNSIASMKGADEWEAWNEPPMEMTQSELDWEQANGKTLITADSLFIPSDVVVEGVIIRANHVYIESGFSGTLQCQASRVTLEEKVNLNYPSGIFAVGDSTRIEIASNCSVDGVVANLGSSALSFIGEESVVHGMVVCDGSLQLEGEVHGPLMVDVLQHISPSSSQINAMVNGKIIPGNFDMTKGLPLGDGKRIYIQSAWLD